MKLLIDQNLSFTLASSLADLFPGSTHVQQLRLAASRDPDLWALARARGYVLLTKDQDFESQILHPGPPPKGIILYLGNTTTVAVERLIRSHAAEITAFETDGERILRVR